MKSNIDKKSSNQKLKNQKETEYENDNESNEEEEEEEEEVKINKNTKNTTQNKLPVRTIYNKDIKVTSIKKEEKPKISQTLYKPRLITTQNQDNNKISLRRKLQEKRTAPTKDSEQTPKKSEPVKTYENQIGQTQLESHIHPPASKNQSRYTKRQIDSSFNEENNEKEIKNIEDKNKEDIKEIKKEPTKETKKEPRKEIRKEPKIDDKEKKDKKDYNTLNKEKEISKLKEKEKEKEDMLRKSK